MKRQVEIIILAAGASSRMRGGDKTLEEVGGTPLLRHLAQQALASKATATHVVLPADRPSRNAALHSLNLHIIVAKNAQLGMSASLKAGISAAKNADGALILLADMPEITSEHIDKMIDGFQSSPEMTILRAATTQGKSGHPVIFDKCHFKDIATLTGDQGARKILSENQDSTVQITLSGDVAAIDLDTPEDWAAWRKG